MGRRAYSGSAELRQSVIVLAVLGQLRDGRDGWGLRRALAEGGVAVEEAALFPLLRRLEAEGLLAGVAGADPARRHYRLSVEGRRAFAASAAQLCRTWHAALGAPQDAAGAQW